jgi:NADPH:quinone reductase-like Zn-dependent oxidoreductase
MRAVVHTRYGSVDELAISEVPTPVPGAGEVLVAVRATSVHPDVWHVVTGRPLVLRVMGNGLRRPKQTVPGTDLAGVVEAVGPGVTEFAVGDDVYGESVRGHQWKNGGAFAEFAAAPVGGLARKPAELSFRAAAAIPTAALIALQAVTDEGKVRAGQRVLVNGAGGGVGVFAVQIARSIGATVTAVDAASKLEELALLGAHQTIDYTTHDFTQDDITYDVIIDLPGNHPWRAIKRVVAPDGRYVLVGHDRYGASGGLWFGGIPRVVGLVARSLTDPPLRPSRIRSRDMRMEELARLVDRGVISPRVDRELPLEEAAAALHYLATGAPIGKVVLVV